ncbi:MAG TPA: DNA primase [Candidatus Saccharibacteria bacterium]|nr:DNA primase [Candidatus Saccharibacteria bacterium]
MQDAKEDVRSRLNIEEVIGEYVQLSRAGRNFKGLSPFTGEKTPSFIVSPEKNIWHDFSSNKGGDVFSFIMEVEGVEFKEALELLARKAGVDLSQYSSSGDSQVRAKQKRRLLALHSDAAHYYQRSLISNQHAVEYVFKKRGFDKPTVTDFRVGYAPDSGDALISFLTKKGYSKNELNLAGVTNRFGGDLFRGRLMVPLMDGAGQVIGFTARILKDDPKAPKYLNTPQTMSYDKSRHIFGLSQAKEAIRTAGYAVLVEGNLDVVSSHQAGVKQVVATAGTAMTEHHLKALSRLVSVVKLAFDGDSAGIAATERALAIAQKVGIELLIVSLPSTVKDPDELVKQDVALWQQAIDEASPVVDWLIDQYMARENMESPSGKRRFTSAVLQVIRLLADSVEQDHYLQKIVTLTGISLDALREKLSEQPEAVKKPLKKVVQTASATSDATSYQDNLLALTLMFADLRPSLTDIAEDMMTTDERRAVLQFLKTHTKDIKGEVPRDLKNIETYVKILLLKADTRYGQWSDNDRASEVARLIRQLIVEHKKMQKEYLTQTLRVAEDEGDEIAAEKIRQQLNELIKEIARA